MDMRLTGTKEEINEAIQTLRNWSVSFDWNEQFYPRRNEKDQYSAYLSNVEFPSI